MTEPSNTVPLITEQLLEDYADGRLDPQTERRIEGLIAQDPVQREKVIWMIALREAVRADVSARAGIPVREGTYQLIEEIERRRRKAPSSSLRKAVMAMAASLLLVGFAGLVWSQFTGGGRAPLEQAALSTLLTPKDSQQQAEAALEAAGGSSIQATVEPAAQTTPKQPMPEFVPNFTSSGFNLVETRVLPKEAVHLLYETKDGRRVSLYYSEVEKGQNQQVSLRQEGPLAVLFWYAEGRSFSMIGEVDREELIELARLVTSGLSVEEKKSEDGGDGQTAPEKQDQEGTAPTPESDSPSKEGEEKADAV